MIICRLAMGIGGGAVVAGRPLGLWIIALQAMFAAPGLALSDLAVASPVAAFIVALTTAAPRPAWTEPLSAPLAVVTLTELPILILAKRSRFVQERIESPLLSIVRSNSLALEEVSQVSSPQRMHA